jgi:hypothetical protein
MTFRRAIWPAKISLLEVTRRGRRFSAAGDGEERGHAAVRRAVGVPYEPCFAHRAIGGDERRHLVAAGASGCRKRKLRVDGRARTADRRLSVAAAAAIEVHPRPESFVDFFDFGEILLAALEERELTRREPLQRTARARGTAANARVAGRRRDRLRGQMLRLNDEQRLHRHDGSRKQHESTLLWIPRLRFATTSFCDLGADPQ